jgi:hypothetical protein
MMADRLLVVEGEEDAKFFKTVLRKLELNEVDVKCHPAGKGNAIATFAATLKKQTKGGRAQIGLVVDADFPQDGHGHAASVKDINSKVTLLGYKPMTKLAGGGYAFSPVGESRTQAGVWVMPDCAGDGHTEHLLQQLISAAEQPRFQYAQQACDLALDHKPTLDYPVKSHHRAKAQLGTWLAWQHPPRMSFGFALKESLFDFESPAMRPLRSWLNGLFS